MRLSRRSLRSHSAITASVLAALVLSACEARNSSTTTAATTSSSAVASPVASAVASPTTSSVASGPGGTGSTTAVMGTAAYTLSGGSASKSGTTISASSANQSGVLVKSAGKLTLDDVTVSTTGKSSSSDNSSFYGLDSGVLAFTGSSIDETGGSVTTTGDGANAVFAYGTGSSVVIANTKITATGQYAHGIMSSGGGLVTATDLTVDTAGASSAAVATDRGGGTIKVVGGTYTTTGANSPGQYSTGTLTATGATFVAKGAEAVVVEGSNSVTVTNSSLTGTKNRGVMIYQSFSGDAQGSTGTFSETGGSLAALDGPLFFVTNATGAINLSGVTLSATSGVLLDAAAASWGTSGSNGGHATIKATNQSLAGNVVADKISSADLELTDSSTLTGAVNTANTAKSVTVSLDKSSTWTVTADSYLTVLNDAAGVSGTTITNIVGNGHAVYYNSSDNPTLGGKTYTLPGGGTLKPA